jgi:hypothetical protein
MAIQDHAAERASRQASGSGGPSGPVPQAPRAGDEEKAAKQAPVT